MSSNKRKTYFHKNLMLGIGLKTVFVSRMTKINTKNSPSKLFLTLIPTFILFLCNKDEQKTKYREKNVVYHFKKIFHYYLFL